MSPYLIPNESSKHELTKSVAITSPTSISLLLEELSLSRIPTTEKDLHHVIKTLGLLGIVITHVKRTKSGSPFRCQRLEDQMRAIHKLVDNMI
ncbi:hypothetical protein VNO77_14469 [Canavalia gladiata]|uniref:Uncharacterized protein n=1 Tax=Canavalia gladiata TaxID=3824 RepID=A0AAN9LYS7_CANGL